MKGRILGFDNRTGAGMIAGDDGRRFEFSAADWKQGMPPRSGQNVNFDPQDTRALSIYALGGGSAMAGDKNRIVAALLAFFLGVLGIHKFYLGKNTAGVIMLLCGTIGWLLILPGIAVGLIAFIEFIIYLVTSDEEFHRKYVEGDTSWF